MKKLLFDSNQIEKVIQMAKKAAKSGVNVSAEIREALAKLGKNASHTDVGELLAKKFPDDIRVARSVGGRNFYQLVYGQKKRLTPKKSKRGDTVGNSKRGNGGGGKTDDVALFALKYGGIDGARAALDELEKKLA